MLITGDECGNKWKVVKNDKIKVNTNKTSACSMPSKVPSPVALQDRFGSLIITKESSISQVQTPTNYHQRIEIQNTNLNQELNKGNPAVYNLRQQTIITYKLKIQ